MDNYSHEDVGNIMSLEHLNVQVPDQAQAILFYVVGLGLTRDPYLTVGLENMWVNAGEQQFHLPTRAAQVVPGHIGLVIPDPGPLRDRLKSLEARMKGTLYRWSDENGYVAVTCPWGNRFRCHAQSPISGDMALGVAYIEFLVPAGAARAIARFYEVAFHVEPALETREDGIVARIKVGRDQALLFRETTEPLAPYDGHHVAIYVANFSGPYRFLEERGLIMEEIRNHQFRFKQLVDPDNGQEVFLLEHEVRSLHHPMFHRRFVNRDPIQTQRAYRRGRDSLIPYIG
jgi:hypothetical protein